MMVPQALAGIEVVCCRIASELLSEVGDRPGRKASVGTL